MTKGSASKIPAKIQRQNEEREAIARAKAERLLSPQERSIDNAPEVAKAPTPEPSLEERLAAIDRRAREHATAEKAALAGQYLGEARRTFARAIDATSDAELKAAFETMSRLEKMAGDSTAGPGQLQLFNGHGSGSGDGRRVRRSVEDLKADAVRLADWLRDHPGSKGSEAVAGANVIVKPPLNVRSFLSKFAPGIKLIVDGQKAGVRYSVK